MFVIHGCLPQRVDGTGIECKPIVTLEVKKASQNGSVAISGEVALPATSFADSKEDTIAN
jgi:hypothetical protein